MVAANTAEATDSQIRQLARLALTASQHEDCAVALGRKSFLVIEGRTLVTWRPTSKDRRAARRRCAALITAKAVR